MESLALTVFILWCCMFLIGPFAVLFDYFDRPVLAGLSATIAIWLGVFWFAHTYTWPKYMGLFSAAMGLYVVWRNARRY